MDDTTRERSLTGADSPSKSEPSRRVSLGRRVAAMLWWLFVLVLLTLAMGSGHAALV